MGYLFTDELWKLFEPHVTQAKLFVGGRPPQLSDRLFCEAILYWARTGIPWRDLPREFGSWDAVYNRFGRWVRSGSLQRLFELLTADPALGDVRRAFIDSTILRVHQHAAGARRKKKRSGPLAVLAKKVSVAAAEA
jgi:transposase